MRRQLQVSPGKTPQVVAALLDAEAPEEFVTNLILSVRSLLPVDKLVEVGGWVRACVQLLCMDDEAYSAGTMLRNSLALASLPQVPGP
jgi:hypothetical protein